MRLLVLLFTFLSLACQPDLQDDPYRFTLQDDNQCVTSASHKTKAAYCADLLDDKKWGKCAKEERLAKYNAECTLRVVSYDELSRSNEIQFEESNLESLFLSAQIDEFVHDQLNNRAILTVSYNSTSCSEDEFSLEMFSCDYKNNRMTGVAKLIRKEMAPDPDHCNWFIGKREVALDLNDLYCSPQDLIIRGENKSEANFTVR